MPFAQVTRIREVSSEDNQHLAENLIKPQSGRKWKTKNAGEKSAYVIFEMDSAQQITGIDIGNEHSAFVEVLVGNFTCAPGDFTEILITCSFMTPMESRNSDNTNRVRCFSADALVPTVAKKKWSLVKVICTQPFNKHVQYGLSFIKIHVAQSPTTKVDNLPSQITFSESGLSPNPYKDKPSTSQIGKLKIRADSSDSESDVSSSLFNRWKKSKENVCELTAATSVRAAASAPGRKLTLHAIIQKPKTCRLNDDMHIPDRNRETLLFGDTNDDVDSKREARLAKEIEADKKRRRLEQQRQLENKEERKSVEVKKAVENKQKIRPEEDEDKPNTLVGSTSSARGVIVNDEKRKGSSAEKPPKRAKFSVVRYKPLNELLSGVVLVISGIQNPDRASIRDKALALGAKYKGDWDNTCTHLICAFKNTPKYNQVKGRGKIITRTWVEKCYQLKKYLPWRRYALDSQELAKEESDEEICADSLRPLDNPEDAPHIKTKTLNDRNDTLALYDLGEQSTIANNNRGHIYETSDSDTDDEIQRIEKKNATDTKKKQKETESGVHAVEESKIKETSTNQHKKSYTNVFAEGGKLDGKPMLTKSIEVYEATTDEEDYLQDKKDQVNFSNFFRSIHFFICDDISSVDRIELEGLIVPYAGCLSKILSEANIAVSISGAKDLHCAFCGKIV